MPPTLTLVPLSLLLPLLSPPLELLSTLTLTLIEPLLLSLLLLLLDPLSLELLSILTLTLTAPLLLSLLLPLEPPSTLTLSDVLLSTRLPLPALPSTPTLTTPSVLLFVASALVLTLRTLPSRLPAAAVPTSIEASTRLFAPPSLIVGLASVTSTSTGRPSPWLSPSPPVDGLASTRLLPG